MYGNTEILPPIDNNTFVFPARINKDIKVAFIADFHDRTFSRIMSSFEKEKPDLVLIAGDLISWHTIKNNNMTINRYIRMIVNHEIYIEDCGHLYTSRYALDFLKHCVEIAPTFYSLGNHEKYFDARDREFVKQSGAILLDNQYVLHDGLAIGGLSSAYVCNMSIAGKNASTRTMVSTKPVKKWLDDDQIKWLDDFEQLDVFKILLNHHPEYYDLYLEKRKIDLILAGHAHGGQIRIGEKGLYAPGQGLFPKYSSGLYHNRMIVSRGIANVSQFIPRINNHREVIYISLISTE